MEADLDLPSDNDNEGNAVDSGIVGDEERVDMDSFKVNKSGMNGCIPQTGIEFETKEEAYSFYREYARSVGFGITIKASRRSKKSGKFIDIKIACSRFGSNRHSSTTTINPKSCPKTDCKASIHLKKRQEGKWYVYSFSEEHNHEICPDDFYYAVRGRKNRKSNDICQKKKGLQDVQLLLDYFMEMQAESPGFYYVLDFDEESRMRSVFWIDPKGRRDYIHFNDVVFFDTYYIKSKYNLPFIPVIGVNHHFQFVLLGCGLIGDSRPSTFVWLMRTWLRAVSGCSPKVVITDNDKSVVDATVEVFPDASHYFCPTKLSDSEAFLMEVRRWIPTYMRNVFLGGFCTVERSDSIASFFDKYLEKGTILQVFINRYKLFLHDSCEEEVKAEIENQHNQITSISQSLFEKQMCELYTSAIYRKFQAEVYGINACTVEHERSATFSVNDLETKENFTVSWNGEKNDICCSCCLFEYSGFLCRHALSVFQLLGISTIPSRYILKRWTRNAKIRDTDHCSSTNVKDFRVERLNDLCKVGVRLSDEGSLSREAYQVARRAIDETLKHCIETNKSIAQKVTKKQKVEAEDETNKNKNKNKNQRSVIHNDSYLSLYDCYYI